VSSADGTGRLFVAEQGGAIWIVSGGAVRTQPFLDLRDLISTGGERGLLGLTFHPDYRCNGRFFVDYTDRDGNTVVAEYRVSADDPNRADPASETILLHVRQPFPNHNGGEVIFGSDGFLYVGLGDGGSGGDPQGNGQRLDTLLGKLLRIDVDHPSAGRAYGIPADNPFVGQSSARPEIYSYGLRNPWRFTFDRLDGSLWIGDVGQNRFEEVDGVPAGSGRGANFGWNRMEASHCYPDNNCDRSGLVLPVTEYDHSKGDCAVIGGYVYRGAAITGLAGRYLFADQCTGTIRVIDGQPKAPQAPVVLLESQRVITSFGEDDAGELYVVDAGAGELLKVVTAP
jgi:glucose/arabinose dehydrogenase